MATPEVPEQRASRACVECHASKTRCTWPGDVGIGKCLRCLRSKRACSIGRPSGRGRASSRVGQLEQRLDGIVSLLQASQRLHDGAALQGPAAPIHYPLQSQPASSTAPTALPRNDSRPTASAVPSLDSHIMLDTHAAVSYAEIFPGFRVTFDEANRLLDIYRISYSPLFPFVPVSQTLTVDNLYSQRPLLFSTIMHIVAPQTDTQQCDFAVWFRGYIAQHVIVEQEKRLEILQAILLRIAWAPFQFYRGNETTNLLQLAIAQAIDLGLSQPSRAMSAPFIVNNHITRLQKISSPQKQSLEDMRSMLGCFFLCSIMSTLLRKIPQSPDARHLTACCAELNSAQEYQSDPFLIALVKMQQLACRACTVLPNPEFDAADTDYSASLFMTMLTIRNDLTSIKDHLPSSLQNNPLVLLSYFGTLMRLYEPAIHTRPSNNLLNNPDSRWRTEALWQCLQATRQFFDTFLAVPMNVLILLPFPCMAYLSFGLTTACWLVSLHDFDWDVQLARDSLGFTGYIDRIAKCFEEAEQVSLANATTRRRIFWREGVSLFVRYVEKARLLKSWVAPTATPGLPSGVFDADGERPNGSNLADNLDPLFWETLMYADFGTAMSPMS